MRKMKDLLRMGAMGASMTGSGPTVFGIFPDQSSAAHAAEAMSAQYTAVFLCQPIKKIAERGT